QDRAKARGSRSKGRRRSSRNSAAPPDRGDHGMGRSDVKKAGPYRYTLCGLDNVYLLNGYQIHDTPYGAGVSIVDVDGLHRAIAHELISHTRALGGREVRFLRKELELSQAGLAHLMEVTPQTVARWEKGQTVVPGPVDRLIRLLYVDHIGGNPEVRKLLDHIGEIDLPTRRQRVFEDSSEGWRSAA